MKHGLVWLGMAWRCERKKNGSSVHDWQAGPLPRSGHSRSSHKHKLGKVVHCSDLRRSPPSISRRYLLALLVRSMIVIDCIMAGAERSHSVDTPSSASAERGRHV